MRTTEFGLSNIYEDFPVDLKHLMENIKDHYVNLSIEEAVIVENVDNCIDERYSEIHFNMKSDGMLEILMLGDGIPPKIFFNTLPKIAATVKIPKKRVAALGRYGWGMKICMCVADYVIIETKYNNFHGAQSWKLFNGIPKRRKEQPKKKIRKNFTLITIKLTNEYKEKITSQFIEETLRKFYPTILRGARVQNRHGERRTLKMFVNSRPVAPPPEISYEKRKPLTVKIGSYKATGYIYLAKETLDKEDTGIAIIVHGRKITRDFFGTHGSMDQRITGYLHADMLIEDLAGDKTILRRNSSRWRKLSEGAAKQLAEFMKEIGAIREEKLPKKMIKRIHEEINNLIRHFPKLQELARKAGISVSREVLISKQDGEVPTKLEEGSQRTRGIEAGSKGGQGVPVKPGEEPDKAPSGEEGESRAVRSSRRRKRGLEIYVRPEPDIKKEAWFSPEGVIIVNSSFPTYKKADKMRSLEYHMERCAIEALLNYAIETEIIKKEEATKYWDEVFAKWGEL